MHRAVVLKPRKPRQTPQPQRQWQPYLGDPFAHDVFFFRAPLLGFGYEYAIADEAGTDILFARKRLFSFVHHVDVYAAGSDAPVLVVRQDSPFQFIVRQYTVFDAAGQPIAAISQEPQMGFSLFGGYWRCRYTVTGATLDTAARVEPEMDLVGANCSIFGGAGYMVGRWVWRLSLTDQHTLDLTTDPGRSFDRRLAVALGVLLESIHRRSID